MCGIHGLLTLHKGELLDKKILQRMGDVTTHRGPDDAGEYVGDGILLGMRRLSIIDVSGGHQPIPNENSRLWVVCNGEIYNFRELRERLIRAGHRFRTGSDSEVIPHLYEEYGDEFINHLDGMYAFALWDVVRHRLLIGRDRLGIKPLYYYHSDHRLIFASEAKSILAVPGIKAEINPRGLQEYLTLGYCPTPYSMLHGINKLPPASLMVCENGKVDIRRYWRLSGDVDNDVTLLEWTSLLKEKLEMAVSSQMVSDVPLGAFLSGGIDSSTVVAYMARHSQKRVKTYAIGFEGASGSGYYNELPYARRVSKLFNTDHKEIIVKPDVASLLPQLIWHMDEPMADTAFVTTFLVSQFARRDVTVILSGVGGDELFGGYRRYLGDHYGRIYNRLPAWLRRNVLAPLAHRLPSDRHNPLLNLSRYTRQFILSHELSNEERYRRYIQVFDRERCRYLLRDEHTMSTDSLDRAFEHASRGDTLRRLLEVDIDTQLPDDLLMLTDKMTMATSIECRVPLLDQGLVEMSARIPEHIKIRGGTLKYILKHALKGLLPHDVLHRPKRGFGAPMGSWLKKELAPFLNTMLSRKSVEDRGMLNWPAVEDTIRSHMSNTEDHTDHLLALINLELWCRIYLDGQQPAALSETIREGTGH